MAKSGVSDSRPHDGRLVDVMADARLVLADLDGCLVSDGPTFAPAAGGWTRICAND